MSKVGVNLLWLVPGVVGGSEDATIEMLDALDEYAPSIELSLWVRPELVREYPRLEERLRVHVVAPGASKVRRVWTENRLTDRLARSDGVDFVHHAGGVIPPLSRAPAVVTIHDTQPLDLPHHFSRVKRQYLRLLLPRSARRSRLVLCPSTFSAGRVALHSGIDPSRIAVVPWSVRPLPTPDENDIAWYEDRFGDVPIVIYPAITHPHKNHQMLIRAFSAISTPARLVFTGGAGGAHQAVLSAIQREGNGRVEHLGRVPRSRLSVLMRRASALAFPSEYEGFGLPMVEAMQVDTPVVAAHAGALPEISEALAHLDPHDVSAWTSTLDAVLGDASERERRIAIGCVERVRFTRPRAAAAWSAAVAHVS